VIRQAKRVLTGAIFDREPDIRYGQHEKGGMAVTVDLRGWNDTRTFRDPRVLRLVSLELAQAADLLEAANGTS